MSAKNVDRNVFVKGFVINRSEVIKNGALAVASNRLKGPGKNPTPEQIRILAGSINKKIFSDSRSQVMASIPRF
jgi:hypothetical protein